MKNKKLIAIVLTICTLVSTIAVSSFSASAVFSFTTFDSFVTNQVYSRGMSAASTILSKIGDATGSEEVQSCVSFINKWVFGGNDTGAKLSAIQETCNEILASTADVKNIAADVQSLNNAEAIKTAASDCDDAWSEQVEQVLKENDLNNIFEKYIDYLSFSSEYEQLPAGKTIEDYENIYIQTLQDVYAKHGYPKYDNNCGDRNEFYNRMMYTTDTLDVIFCDCVEDLLDCMENKELFGDRYIDKAALYAYYAFPFSSEQAAFVDAAVERQVNKITIVLMMYQDFLAHRADYYSELNLQQAEGYENIEQCNSYFKIYSDKYNSLLNEFMEDTTEFFNSKIVLDDGHIYATTTFEKYLRDDSASTKANNNQSFKLKCNKSFNSQITATPSFYKNASVTIANGELVFTPFYILNGDVHNDATYLKTFNSLKKETVRCVNVPSYTNYIYGFTDDYKCLKNGVYSDGNNDYAAVTNVDTFKSLINTTAYSAYKYTPFTYFGDYLKYAGNDSLYLFLRADATRESHFYTYYYDYPAYNLKNSKSYNETWNNDTLSQPDISGERYAVVLTPQSSTLNTTIDSQVKGEGSVYIDGKTEGTFASGSLVNIKIEVPETHVITSVKAQFHGDISNPSKVTSEKTLCGTTENTLLELPYGVPYTNVTIKVETKALPAPLDTDFNGKYIVNDYYDLLQMSDMVNSGYSKYVNGDYILKGNANCRFFEWTAIGTENVQFNGTFDGNGHFICDLNSGMDVSDGNRHTLFNILGERAEVKNIYFTYADVYSSDTPVEGSGIVCKQNNGTISNIMIADSTIQLDSSGCLGGVAGVNNGTIENCCVVNSSIIRNSDENSEAAMGGIAEENNGTIKNCYTYNCQFKNGNASNNAPIVSKGNAPENCYFFTGSNVNKTFGTEKFMGRFESGEVAYLLNNGVTDGTQSFYQYIGGDFYPVLFAVESLTTVYKTESGTYTNSR